MEETIIMYDSPEAAQQKQLMLWVSSDGRAYSDERTARYAGCTHKKCECGEITSKHYTCCENCRAKLDAQRYLAMPIKEWDEETPICTFGGDKYFFDVDDLLYYCEDQEIKMSDLQLVICEPQLARQLDDDYFCDELPEDGELPDEIKTAIKEFNKKLQDYNKPLSWMPGKFRTEVKDE